MHTLTLEMKKKNKHMKQNRITFIFISIQPYCQVFFGKPQKKNQLSLKSRGENLKLQRNNKKIQPKNRKQKSKNKNKINTPKIFGFENEKIIKKRI